MGTLTRLAGIITDMSFLNPTNLADEKAKFLVDNSYEPQFEYRELDFDTDAAMQDLERLLQEPQDDDERISTIIQERVRELMRWLSLLEARGTDRFTDISKELFGPMRPMLAEKAEELLNTSGDPVEEELSLDAKEAHRRIQEALSQLSKDWRAVIDEKSVSDAYVNSALRTIKIRHGARFSERALQRLIVHEVGVHAKRAINGAKQQQEVFSIGTAGYLETEEGLAIHAEEQAGYLDGSRLKEICARVIAIREAQDKSFSKTFQRLTGIVGADEAFTLAVRAKRGFKDTGRPGGLTKDQLYLKGYLRIQEMAEEDVELLYLGKVSYHQLPVLKELLEDGKVKAI